MHYDVSGWQEALALSRFERRVLLLGSLAAPLARTARAQAGAQPVGAGMIGVGNRGAHTMRVAMQVPGVKMVAVCDIKPDRLDKAATAAARDNPKPKPTPTTASCWTIRT